MSNKSPVPPRSSWVQLTPAAVLWLLAAGFLMLTADLPKDAQAIPLLVGWTTLVLVSIDFLSRLNNSFGQALMRALNPSALKPDHEGGSAWRVASGVLLVVVLIGAFLTVGVLAAAAIVIFGALMFAYPRQLLSNLLVAAGATAGIWLLFSALLGLSLYRGVFFGDVL